MDGKYSRFITQLHQVSVTADLGVDLATLGLTGAGAVASKAAANALSAASTGLVGAGTAFSKDVFYQKTLPAIVAQMDANRASVYKTILTSEQSDETSYTLADSQHDIRNYQEAGTIDTAIAAITSSAQQSTASDTSATKALLSFKYDTGSAAGSLRDFIAPGGTVNAAAMNAANACVKSQAPSGFDLSNYTLPGGAYDLGSIASDPAVPATYKTAIVTCAKTALASPAPAPTGH